jgi:hypothetical protein
LFCALLEVFQIPTAFITIPGHIYMAFDTGAESEWSSRKKVRELLIEHEGRWWLPIEITVPGQGFYRAWKIGREEWLAAAAARLFPTAASWELYPPVSVNGAGDHIPGFPGEDALLDAFAKALRELQSATE